MKCLGRTARFTGIFIVLICSILTGSSSQYVHAQSSSYNLTSSYIIQEGDTISAIAARYRISIHQVATTNNIRNINQIRVGQVIIIPVAENHSHLGHGSSSDMASVEQAIEPLPMPQYAPQSHISEQSETLYSEPASVYSAPPELPEQSQIPAPIQASAQSTGECIVNPGPSERIHHIRPGDTLYGMARTYGVAVTAVRQRNGLASERIRVGECLVVPAGNTVTPVPDRRRTSEHPIVTDTPVTDMPVLTPTPSQSSIPNQGRG